MRKGKLYEAGFTLVEVMVAFIIFALLTTAVLFLFREGYRSYFQELDRQKVEADLRRALDRMSLRIREAEKVEYLDPQDPSAGIKVRLPKKEYTYTYNSLRKELQENGQPVTGPVVTGANFNVWGSAVSVELKGEKGNSGEVKLSTQVIIRVGEQG